MSGTIGLADLPEHWRVEVSPAWSGLPGAMNKTFAAQLQERPAGKRWRDAGVAVLSDNGPTQAVRDLLTVLSDGRLPR